MWKPMACSQGVAKKGFSTSYNPKVNKFDLYCVIDQEQQSTGQFRAALSRGLEHAVAKKFPNPTPNHRGDEGPSPRGHITALTQDSPRRIF